MSDTDPRLDESDAIEAESRKPDYSVIKRRLLIMLLAYAALFGVLAVVLPEDDLLSLVLGIPALILAVMWCHADAKDRDLTIGRFMGFSLVLFFVLAFTVYVFQTRGLGGFKTLGLTALFVAVMVGCLFASACLSILIGVSVGLIE